MSATDIADPKLQSLYSNEDKIVRLRRYKIACILSLIGTASGLQLDYLAYPQFIWPLATIRVTAIVLIFIIYKLASFDIGRTQLISLNLAWAIIVNGSISAMVYTTGGAVSPYYAGLNLVILAAGVLLPWTLAETLSICIATLLMYISICVLYALPKDQPLQWVALFSNCFFIFLTGLISSTSSYFTTQARIKDFNLRQELDVRNKELEDMDRQKSQFFSNISHELRTPLTLILSPIQDLLQQPEALSDRVSFLLRTARDNSLRLLKLVNDLLEVIKLEEGKRELELRTTDINGFLGSLVDSMTHLAEARGVSVEKRFSDKAAPVWADSYALERIFLNLLSNAIKFTSKGESITVSTAFEEERAKVIVADTGMGIKSEELPHIFDRFRQADGSSTRKHQGSGLGLALVKELTEQMGGTISIESQPNIGTTIIVSLPLRADDLQQIPPEPPQTDPAKTDDALDEIHQAAEHRAALPIDSPFEKFEAETPKGSGPSLMIVDDEPDMRQYLVSILEQDYRISQIRDGKRALEVAPKQLPDLMLLDLMLPEVDGLEICKQLKADPVTRKIKIILLTARSDEKAKITALENGADDFITKPFNRSEVEKRLENLIENSRLEKELRTKNQDLEETLAALKQTQLNLIQSEKLNALGKMAAGLLHEINNPLNYVIAALQMAQLEPEAESNEELKDNLSDIDEGIERIKNIVSDLHAFAHPSDVSKQLPFSISKAIEVARRFTAADCAGIAISCELEAEDTAMGSEGHIVQVLVNLLSNATKAINALEEERITEIRIRTSRSEDRIEVSISDNGIGMSKETLNRVFDPFFTTRDVGEGMGLGLSISHTIIQNHGGTLQVKSIENGGTTFRFDIPSGDNFIAKDIQGMTALS
ncbi:MAG: ATP-binding protein [Verrucomicrobiota bacterium]